ncbi:hypothetical protein M8J77_009899 [Diaphorina citri]|nr:hypothetical protein M8J77_009899 [Diaphorina citri]
MVTKVESFSGTTEPNKNYAMGIGEGGVERRGAATPRVRRGENQSGFSTDMMEVYTYLRTTGEASNLNKCHSLAMAKLARL